MSKNCDFVHKIGLSSFAFSLNEETFKKLSQSGVGAVEISVGLEKSMALNYKEIAELSKNFGVELWSFHLPFMPFEAIDISAIDSTPRNNAIELFSTLIGKASDIGIDKFVIHPSGEPIDDEIREERFKYSMQSLDILARIADKNGAVIAVENLPRTCLGNSADEMLRLISVNEKLRVCFDTNHLLKDNHTDFIKKLGDKIVTLHVSDYDFIDERHWLPGYGKIDWCELYSALKTAEYSGVWMYEARHSAPPFAGGRALDFNDFVNNANEIFNGKKPTRIL